MESEQIGWFRDLRGFLAAAELPAYSNIDLHLGKEFDLDFMKVNLTFSARNILDDDTVLYGIAIRDRRYYMSFGLVY